MASNVSPSTLPATLQSTNDLRAIKPPLEISSGWIWVWCAVGLLVLVLAAWIVWRRRHQIKPLPIVPVVPAHVRAKERLRRALALLSEPGPFCTEVSSALRIYLEERFTFRAPERTTEEFLEELKATNLLLPDQKTSLGDFLQRCDLVKFARHEPPESELRELHESALRLIDETQFEPVQVAEKAVTP